MIPAIMLVIASGRKAAPNPAPRGSSASSGTTSFTTAPPAPAAAGAAVTTAFFSLVPGYALQRILTGSPDKETYMRGVRELLNR
ncbi:hypothetical protein ACGFJ7_05125 [Actinoplanes sp. NPDC048988]|uniref:hypothetical protein n=1 Tax=Actinoplanes sp. NPDC048988 TaxID=3363901 RepID=UPI003713FBD4